MKNVLVFPAGSEIGLEINNALKYSKHFKVYGLTSTPNHSEYVFSNCITGVPYFDSPDFIEKLNEVIKEYEIDYIFPLIFTQRRSAVQNQKHTGFSKTRILCRIHTLRVRLRNFPCL